MPKIIVYLRAADAKELEAEGKEPAKWVRAVVQQALEKRKESR